MANTFDFIGTLNPIKESEKFKPYEEKTYNSGWVNRSLKFNVVAGTNRHMLEIKGGCWADGHGVIKAWSKAGAGEKGEPIDIPWSERQSQENLDKVAQFKKFVVDLEKPGRRNALRKIADGELTDENLTLAGGGIESMEDAVLALKASEDKRHEFLSEYDFAAFVQRLVTSDKIKGIKFRVSGNLDITEYDGKFYQHFVPTRVLRATDDAEIRNEATINIHYGKGAIDDGSVEDKGRYYVNGFTWNYDSQRKKKIPCPMMLVLPVGKDEKSNAYVELLKRNFTISDIDGGSCKELTVKVDCVDGAEAVELTDDMLSENEKDLLIIGAITMDDIVRDRGKQVYGDRVREFVVTGFAKGWLSGAKQTAYTEEDFKLMPVGDTKIVDDIFETDEDDLTI